MGPRLEGRGNGKLYIDGGTFSSLQWGRVLKDAEITRRDMMKRVRELLQWGRVLKDAEILKLPMLFGIRPMLQWGRVLKDAEIV